MGYRSNLYEVCTENSHERGRIQGKEKNSRNIIFVRATVCLVIHGACRTPHLLVSCLLTGQCLYGDI